MARTSILLCLASLSLTHKIVSLPNQLRHGNNSCNSMSGAESLFMFFVNKKGPRKREPNMVMQHNYPVLTLGKVVIAVIICVAHSHWLQK